MVFKAISKEALAARNSASPNTLTDVDIVSMRLLDILMSRDIEEYPELPENRLAPQLDEFASSPQLERKLIVHPLFHPSMRSRPIIGARNRFLSTWKKAKRQGRTSFEPTMSRFNFLLFVDPSIALRELQALHVYDILSERFAQIRKVTAIDVNRTLVVLHRQQQADAASTPGNLAKDANKKQINEAFDMVSNPKHPWAPEACASSFHVTAFTASMVQGAFTMLPTL